ncbi:MAG: YafY family protein [Chloroflexota bacterium]
MPNTAIRLLTLIMLLQRQPNQKAGELAGALGVSVRTLHRYMEMLDEMGIPIYSERGPYGGFSLVRGYKMPPLVLTPEEAVAVYLGASLVDEMWGRLYQEAAQGALAKLDNLLPDEQRQEVAWARRTLVATGMHRADLKNIETHLEVLRRAVRGQRRIEMLYRSSQQPHPAARQLDPYALVHRWGWWYVVGFCHLRQAVRTFRLDRILELNLRPETFKTPPTFDIRQYLAQGFAEQPQISVRLRFAPEAALLALDSRPLWDTLKEQPDGGLVVTFSAPDFAWAASTILSFGPAVTVLEPVELRRVVQEWAQGVLRQYAPTPIHSNSKEK